MPTLRKVGHRCSVTRRQRNHDPPGIALAETWSPRRGTRHRVPSGSRWLWVATFIALSVVWSQVAVADQRELDGIEFFENRIRPVLVKHCYKCHSSESHAAKGGLALDTRSGIRSGGESGPAVAPSEVDQSLLIEAIRYDGSQMPPDGQLPENVIADFVTWVKIGAPDPRDDDPTPEQATESRSWAFEPPQSPQVPLDAHDRWAVSDVDHFVLARLRAEGLQPVRDADRRSLLRRVYFDLIGLPPTQQQTDAFVNDASPTQQAWQRVVDQLLDSPHFGERWGRHWLDVARYAESTGKEWNWAHPQAWRYRDYVIRSFNKDKRYDQFVREQIAGDLLPAGDHHQRDEQLIACGFLSIGPKSVSIGNDEEFRLDLADEQINTVSRAILGLTVGCARCHDHKFDPIPTEDYYALAGIFLSTQTLFGTSADGFKGRNNKQGTPLLPIGPEAEERHQAFTSYQQRVDELTARLDEQRKELSKLAAGAAETTPPPPPEAGSQEQQDGEQDAPIAELSETIKQLETELEQLKANVPAKADYAMGVRDRDEPEDCQVRLGGAFDQRGDTVPRGFLSVVPLPDAEKVSGQQSGRAELARWLTDPQNPLTARVVVNRVWHHLFGRGLVPTLDNFGLLGQRPSHPKLLDHLSIEFMRDDWSVKRMIRKIVLSRTYRLSTDYDAANAEADPDNLLHWRMTPRRLDAEEIRDAILAISGQLVRYPLQGSPAVARLDVGWIGNEVKEPEFKNYTHNHRSVYLPIVRDQVPEVLQIFDFPNSAEVTGKRNVSIVPGQALHLMNSDFIVAGARKAADHLLANPKLSLSQRVQLAYRGVLARPPLQSEVERADRVMTELRRTLESDGCDGCTAERDALALLIQSLFSSAEFLFLI